MRGGVKILIGVVVATIGFALLNVAIAFLVSVLFENSSVRQPVRYALGFICTGFVYLIAGGATIMITKNRLAKQGLRPRRTMAELERDKEWLQKEV